MFTVKNLCEVLVRRWFKNDKYDLALYGEDIVYPTVIDYRTNSLVAKTRKPISQLINLFDVASAFQYEEVLKLEYQVKEAATARNENAQLGKRINNKQEPALDLPPKLTPNLKKRDASSLGTHNFSHNEDDNCSLFDNHENTNNFSVMLGFKNENSLLSNMANGYFNAGEYDRSNFNDYSNVEPPERMSNKKLPKASRGHSTINPIDPAASQQRVDFRTTFANIKQDENSRKSVIFPKQSKLESLKLEATPSHSEGEASVGKLTPKAKKEGPPKSNSEVSFELQVQLLKEKIEKIDKEKLSISNSGRDKK